MSEPSSRTTETPIWKSALVAASLVAITAIIGGWFSTIGPWYRALNKPWFQPPDWLFGVAWSLIYALIATAAVVAWRRSGQRRLPAQVQKVRQILLLAFGANLLLNIAWSGLFFTLQRPDWALIENAFLWLSIVLMIVLVKPVSRGAAWLLAPYLLWVSLAFVLNVAIVKLNTPFGNG